MKTTPLGGFQAGARYRTWKVGNTRFIVRYKNLFLFCRFAFRVNTFIPLFG
jgi:hypothetical protein